jgi:hypothetical protein
LTFVYVFKLSEVGFLTRFRVKQYNNSIFKKKPSKEKKNQTSRRTNNNNKKHAGRPTDGNYVVVEKYRRLRRHYITKEKKVM